MYSWIDRDDFHPPSRDLPLRVDVDAAADVQEHNGFRSMNGCNIVRDEIGGRAPRMLSEEAVINTFAWMNICG